MNFFSNFLYFFVFQAVQKVLQIATVPIMTAYLSPGEYGLIAINTAMAALTAQCSSFGFINYSERVTFKFFGRKSFPPVFGLTVITGILISLVSCTLLSLFPQMWSTFFLTKIVPPVSWFYLVPVWFAFFQLISNYYYFHLIDIKNGKFYFLINFVKTLATNIIPLGGLIFLRFTILEVILSYFLVEVVFAVYSIVCLKSIVSINLKYIRFLKLGFRFGWPYFVFGITGWIVQQVDKLFLGFYKGSLVLGIYAISLSYCGIYSILSQTISYAFSPVMMIHLDRSKSSQDAEKKVEDAIKIYMLGLQFFALVVAVFSQEAIYIFSNERFHDAFRVVPIILASLVVRDIDTAFNVYYLMNKNKTLYYNAMSFVQAFVILFLNYFLTPKYGGYGAAAALLVSSLIVYFINRNYVMFSIGKQSPQRLMMFGFFLISVNYVLITGLTSHLSMWTSISIKLVDILVIMALLLAFCWRVPAFEEVRKKTYTYLNELLIWKGNRR